MDDQIKIDPQNYTAALETKVSELMSENIQLRALIMQLNQNNNSQQVSSEQEKAANDRTYNENAPAV